MSEELSPATESEKSPKKSKRRVRKRILLLRVFIIVMTLTILLLSLILSLPAIVSTPLVETKILSVVNGAIPGTLGWSDLSLKLWGGHIHLTDFSIITPEDDTIVTFDTLRLRYRLAELLEKRVHVEEIALIHPSVDLAMDSSGMLNILTAFMDSLPAPTEKEPKVKDTTSGELKLPVEIVVDTIYIDSLSLSYEMASPKLSASIEEVNVGVSASLLPVSVAAGIDVRNILYKDKDRSLLLDSLELGVKAEEWSVPELFFRLKTVRDSLSIAGGVYNYLSDTLSAQVDLNSYFSMKTINQAAAMEIGNGGISIGISLQDQINNPSLSGSIRYRGSNISGAPVRRIDIPLSLKDRSIAIKPFTVALDDSIGARIELDADVKRMFPDGFLKPMADLNGVNYACAADVWAPTIPVENVPLKNTRASFNLKGKGAEPDRIDLALELKAHTEGEYNKKIVPLDVDTKVAMKNSVVAIDTTLITVDNNDLFQLSGDVNLKKEVLSIAGRILNTDLSKFNAFLPGVTLNGAVQAGFSTEGKLTAPGVNLDLAVDNLKANDFPVGDITVDADVSPDSGTVAALVNLTGDIISLDLDLKSELFNMGSYVLQSEPNLNLKLENGTLNLSPATKGLVTGRGDFGLNYSGWIGSGEGALDFTLDSIITKQATVDGISLDVAIDDSLITVETLNIALYDSIGIEGTATYHLNGNYTADIESDTIDPLGFVTVVPEDLGVNLFLGIEGKGSVSHPKADIFLDIPLLAWQNVELGTQNVTVNLDGDTVVVGGTGLADLTAGYGISGGNYDASVVVDSFLLDPIMAIAKQEKLKGVVSADIKASGGKKGIDSVRAEIPLVHVTMDSMNLVEGEAIVVSMGKSGIAIDSLHITLADTGKVDLMGTVSNEQVLDLRVDVDIPLAIAENFTSDIEKITGSIVLNGNVKGELPVPDILGEIRFNDISMVISESQQRLHRVSGGVNFSNDGIFVDQFTAYLDDGHVSANGAINLVDNKVTSGDYRMDIVNLPINIPEVMDIRLGGNVNVYADKEKQGIGGTIELLECYFYQYIDPLPSMNSGVKRASVKTKKESSILDEIDLNIKIIPRQNIIVDNNLAYFDIKPMLNVGGKATNPSIEGRMEVLTGELNYLNRKFNVTRGVIDFVNPYEIAPEVDIIAETSIDKWDITIQVEGTVGEELQYISSSKPALEDNEILSLILTGKLASDFNSQEFLMSQLAAAALDKFNASMDIELSTEGVKIGEELSRRLYTEYEMKMEEGEMNQIASVLVKIFDQLRVRGFAETTGDAGGEVQYNVQIR